VARGTIDLNFLLNRTEEETEKGTALSFSRDRTRETNIVGVRLGRERVHVTSYPLHLAYYSAYKGSTAVHPQPAAAQAQENKIRAKACTIQHVCSMNWSYHCVQMIHFKLYIIDKSI